MRNHAQPCAPTPQRKRHYLHAYSHNASSSLTRTSPPQHLAVSRAAQRGLVLPNINGTEALDALAVQAGLSVGQYAVCFGVDPERELVAAYVTESGAEGAMPVKRSGKRNVISLHMGGVFANYPLLRPLGKRSCVVMRRLDAEGKPCLVFALQTSLAARRMGRTRTDTQAPPPAADGAETKGPVE